MATCGLHGRHPLRLVLPPVAVANFSWRITGVDVNLLKKNRSLILEFLLNSDDDMKRQADGHGNNQKKELETVCNMLPSTALCRHLIV